MNPKVSKNTKSISVKVGTTIGAGMGALFGVFGESFFSIYNKSKIPVHSELQPKIVEILDNNTPLIYAKSIEVVDYSLPFFDHPRNDNSIYRMLADGNLTSEEATKMSNSIVDAVGENLKTGAYNSTEILSELKNTFMSFAHNHQDAIVQYAQDVPDFWTWVLGGAITGGLIFGYVARKERLKKEKL